MWSILFQLLPQYVSECSSKKRHWNQLTFLRVIVKNKVTFLWTTVCFIHFCCCHFDERWFSLWRKFCVNWCFFQRILTFTVSSCVSVIDGCNVLYAQIYVVMCTEVRLNCIELSWSFAFDDMTINTFRSKMCFKSPERSDPVKAFFLQIYSTCIPQLYA